MIYRSPDVKPVKVEAAEGDKMSEKTIEREVKGQGEFDLPSSVYISHGVKHLRSLNSLRN